MMSSSSTNSEFALKLAEEFIERCRRGERPRIGEYVRRHPELADEIREVFPAMAILESIAIDEKLLAVEEPPPDAAVAEPVLAQLGDYRIIREVGRGGMGIVYEAEQISLGRHVALKVLPGSKLLDSKQKRRFELEARAAARLHHTNVVPVFGVGEAEGMRYYVMQFIQGLGLDEVIAELKRMRDAGPTGSARPPTGELRASRRHEISAEEVARTLAAGTFDGALSKSREGAPTPRPASEETVPHAEPESGRGGADSSASSRGKLSDTFSLASSPVSLPGQASSKSSSRIRRRTYWHSVANIGIQVADALQHAHDLGILHRDIKPSNLLLDMRGTVWVTDFGLAKASDQQDLTHSGDILGTLRYMPPEAFEGKSDARSDLYALGLTLYEMLALQPAFSEGDRQSLIKLVTAGSPARLEKLNSDIPRDLVTVVHKAIDRDPEHRYRTVGQFSADLERFLNDEPIRARRVSIAERLLRWSRRNPAVASLGAALILVLVTAAIVSSVAAFRFRRLADEKEIERSSAVEARAAAEAERERAEEQERLARRSAYIAQINVAQRVVADPEARARADELLDRWTYRKDREDLRGWEWYFLKSEEDRGRLTFHRIGGGLSRAYWNPRRPLIAALCGGGFELFDAETGKLLRRLSGDRTAPTSGWTIAGGWSPDGVHIAAGWHDGTVRVWAAATGVELQVWQGLAGEVGEVAWSPDGRRIAARSVEGRVRVWDSDSGRVVAAWPDPGTARRLAWRDPVRLTLLAEGGRVVTRYLDGSESVEEPVPAALRDEAISAIAWNGGGSRLALGYTGGSIGIFDPARPEALRYRSHDGESGAVEQLAWSPDGDRIAVIRSGVVDVFRAGDGRGIPEAERMFRRRQPIEFASWSPDGKRLALSSGATVRICDLELDATPPTRQSAIEARAIRAAWSPDGGKLAVLVRGEEADPSSSSLQIWKARPWEILRELPGPYRDEGIAWHPDGRRVAVLGESKVIVEDIETGGDAGKLYLLVGQPYCLAWRPDGARLAAGGNGGLISVLDAATGRVARSLSVSEARWGSRRVVSLSWSPGGRWLASMAQNGTVNLWDSEATEPVETLQVGLQYDYGSAAAVAAWSPTGTRLAVGRLGGSTDGRIWVWKVEDGRARDGIELSGHRPDVWDIAWSSDGRRLASAGADRAIKLWEVESIAAAKDRDPSSRQSRELLTLPGHAGTVRSLAWNPRWPVLASASEDGALLLWDASSGFQLDRSPRSLEQSLQSQRETTDAETLRWRGETHAFLGDWESAARQFDEAAALESAGGESRGWFLTPWWVAGYYDYDLDVPAPPESQTDPWKPIPAGGGAPRRWRPVSGRPESVFSFAELLGSAERVSAFALTRVYATRAGSVAALVGSDEVVSLGVNGARVHEWRSNRGLIVDEDAFFVDLRAGWNTILARVSNNLGGHSFLLRLSREPEALARAHETAGEWEQALTEWTRAAEADPQNLVLRTRRGIAAARIGRQDEAWTELIELEPERAASLAENHYRAGRYREAVPFLRALSATELQPTLAWHQHSYLLAFMLWRLGEMEEYEALCRRILEAFRDSRDVQIAERTSKMCLFAGAIRDPEFVELAGRLADFASENVAAAISRGELQPFMEAAAWHARGIADYRRGRFESVLRSSQKSAESFAAMEGVQWILPLQAADRLFAAMALHRLGKTGPALEEEIAEYRRLVEAIPASVQSTDRIILEAAHREARALIGDAVDG